MSSRFLQLSFRRITDRRTEFRRLGHFLSGVLDFLPSGVDNSTLYADRFFDFMVAGSKGTKMPRGDKQQIMTYPVALPSDTELEAFNSVVVPILAQIQNNRNENKRLSLIRDTILPKLMNGELNIQ